MNSTTASLAVLALSAAVSTSASAIEPGDNRPTIVLVHGAFVDGSGWAGVHRILRDAGYPVVVTQHATTSLADDVATVRRAIDASAGNVILVGHSYGGVIITEAGNDPRVSALVYIAAFVPDQGESVSSLTANSPPDAPAPPILAPVGGYLLLDRSKFQSAFAADVAVDTTRFMADSQLPWGVQALDGKIGSAAWKTRPTWYLVAQDDRMIPPDAQRAMATRAGATIRSTAGSHAVFIARPEVIGALIKEAAAAGRSVATPQ